MIAEKVTKGFDAKTHWLDQPDTIPLSIEVKDFAKFVIRAFDLQAENLIISEYQKIVNDVRFLEKASESVGELDRAELDHYKTVSDSSLKFYIEHSVLCLSGRYDAFKRAAGN